MILSPGSLLRRGIRDVVGRQRRTQYRARFNHIAQEFRKPGSDADHLEATMDWLCRAQDVTGTGGVSAGYSLHIGWRAPYPETTGYIIPTFLRYGQITGDGKYAQRAEYMGDWEIDIQLPSGGVRGGEGINKEPLVFDTGQVISGWLSLFEETRKQHYLDAAVKAADWLVLKQEPDGRWIQNSYHQIAHAYHTRVAWMLLRLHSFTGNPAYLSAGTKNIEWVLQNVLENGWIQHMGFTNTQSQIPHTHTIAYTLRGLLESAPYLPDDTQKSALQAVDRATANIMRHQQPTGRNDNGSFNGKLQGRFDAAWMSTDKYSCLTGNAQFAIILLKLAGNSVRSEETSRIGKSLIDYVKMTQSLNKSDGPICGAVAGSWPVWGKYSGYNYLNWAGKFFADALMIKGRSVG